MQGTMRALIGVATTTGLLAGLGLAAGPAVAETTPPVPAPVVVPDAKVRLKVASNPSMGGDCVLKIEDQRVRRDGLGLLEGALVGAGHVEDGAARPHLRVAHSP